MVASKYNIYFNNNENKYVYNLSSKALVEIDYKMELLLQKENHIDVDFEVEKALYDNGIVTISHELETERMINNMNNVRYNSARMGIFLSLTPDCNLNCSYCYQDVRKGLEDTQFLTNENWNKIHTYLLKKIEKNKLESLTIFLFGGEPMLKEKQLEIYVNEIKKLPTNVMLVLITNGTIFNKGNVKFYCENIDSIQVTMDGIQEIHDTLKPYKNGQGSFEKIYNNVLLLIENKARELTLRINLNRETVLSAYEFIDYLSETGLNRNIAAVKFASIFSTQLELVNGKQKDNVELLDEIANLYLYSARKGLKTYKDYDGGLCIGKMQYGFAIDENLNVYTCPGVLYQTPTAKLEDGDIKILKEEWYQFINNNSDCVKECIYAPICFGGCSCLKECKKMP